MPKRRCANEDYRGSTLKPPKLDTSKRRKAPAGFADLPSEILLKIFVYLPTDDVARAGRTCKRWRLAAKDSSIWSRVDAHVRSPWQAVKLILQLPKYVTYLRISCSTLDMSLPVWLPDITAALRRRCPNLKILILERKFFQDAFCDALVTTRAVTKSQAGACPTVSHDWTGSCFYCSKEVNKDKFAPSKLPQDLRVLSLRDSLISINYLPCTLDSLIPHIKVLDLSSSAYVTDHNVPFFSRLINLEELYLLKSPITYSALESLLKTLVSLKIMDLEYTGICGKKFLALKRYGQNLEEIYLAGTSVDDSYLAYEDEYAFANLEVLCLRNTSVTTRGLVQLFDLHPSVNCVNVAQCNVKKIWSDDNYEYMRDKLEFDHDGKRISRCDHFNRNNRRHFYGA